MKKNAPYSLNEKELTHCPQVKMIGHYYSTDASRNKLPLHHNPGIEICILLKGRFEWMIEERKYLLYQNDCTFTLPWQRHGGAHDVMDAGELVWIIIAPEKFERNGKLKLGNWSKLPASVQNEIGKQLCGAAQPYLEADDYLKQVFSELSDEICTRTTSCWRINRLLDELLYYVARKSAGTETIRKDVFDIERLKKKITADLCRKWTLDDLARLTGYGKTMMNGLMRQQTGYSPMAIVQRLRINHAKEFLLRTKLSITEISLRCGFNSSQHFAVVFKKITGKSPKEWREKPTPKS